MTTSLASYRRNKNSNGNSGSNGGSKSFKNQQSRSINFCVSLSNNGEESNDIQKQIAHAHCNPDNQISDYGRMSSVGDDLSDLNEIIECEDSANEEDDEDDDCNHHFCNRHHRHFHNHLHNYNKNHTHIHNHENVCNVEEDHDHEADNHILEEDKDNYNKIEKTINDNPEHNYMTPHSSAVRKEHNNRRSVVR